jgi:hypothetical protein
MKIPQVQSDIDFEVVNSYTTDLSGIHNIITVDDKSTWVNDDLVTWIPRINKGDDTEKNGFIFLDFVFVNSFISELLNTDRSMSLFNVNAMSNILQEICFVVVMLSLSITSHLQTKVQGHYLSLVWMVNNNIFMNMTVTNTDCLFYHDVSQQIITKT